MAELVIRNGTIVDGTGAPAYVADIAIADGSIVNIGAALPAGDREIDATGRLVTPGFVDIHTHYDGQATWDERLTTVQAQRGMRQGGRKGGDARDRIDAAAAAVLLQGYLDSIAT